MCHALDQDRPPGRHDPHGNRLRDGGRGAGSLRQSRLRAREPAPADPHPSPLLARCRQRGGAGQRLGFDPATNPAFIAASNQLNPVYGRNDRFGGGILPDPITNGPFIGARSTAIRNVDLSFIDGIDPTSYVSRTGMNPYR